MSSWTPRTAYSGIQYGGAQGSYYWQNSINPYASASLCLANCTCYAWGRLKEAGQTDPFDVIAAMTDLGGLPSAWQWHWYPNTADGWSSYSFAGKPRALAPGDLVIWSDNVNGQSRNHVAVIEQVITNRKWYISESLYTEGAAARATNDFQTISNWMLANAPARFFTYRILDLDDPDPQWYGEQWPDFVMLNPLNNVTGLFRFFVKQRNKRRRLIYA